ncbi:MAG TPA: heme-binding domain-containing protein, partial [Bryobacteraceae bacterium]|nr:heme-binding domain-containing protein [Bryobacteraceae bacterium]
AAGLIVAGGLLQLVPFGSDHTNPAVIQEPAWDSPHSRELVKHACFNCHSNETVWPWYSNIAPVSWLTQRDVNQGRAHLNFSEWNDPLSQADDVPEEVQAGGMPPWFYLPLHPEARLTKQERRELIHGLEKTLRPAKP